MTLCYVGHGGSLASRTGFSTAAEDKKRRPLELLEWKLVQVQFYRDTAVALYSIPRKKRRERKITRVPRSLHCYMGEAERALAMRGNSRLSFCIHEVGLTNREGV